MSEDVHGADWFRILSTSPTPEKRVHDLTDGGLAAAIDEMIAIEHPNAYQTDLGALCLCEAVRRWRASLPWAGKGTADLR